MVAMKVKNDGRYESKKTMVAMKVKNLMPVKVLNVICTRGLSYVVLKVRLLTVV